MYEQNKNAFKPNKTAVETKAVLCKTLNWFPGMALLEGVRDKLMTVISIEDFRGTAKIIPIQCMYQGTRQ